MASPEIPQHSDQSFMNTPARSPGKMRSRQRPSSSHGATSHQRNSNPIRPPIRKIFNCIVDDTALVAGVKRSTRNGIRQWVKNGQIRLFVPLHALEQLRRQTGQNNRHGEDVRETLQWLDEATTKYPDVVALQGADEIFERWAEVEKFVVPRTLFSENYLEHEQNHGNEYDGLPEEIATKLNISSIERGKSSMSSNVSERSTSSPPSSLRSAQSSINPESPPTSPLKSEASLVASLGSITASTDGPQSTSAIIPQQHQDLFNYILWRIHQETDPVAALESFIFLCNDPGKGHYAKGFDIKTKRLEQLRDAVGREDRDYRNRQLVLNRESQEIATNTPKQNEEINRTDSVVVRPSTPKAPAAMLQKQQQSNLIDPNAFGGRGPQPYAPAEQQPTTPKSPRSPNVQPNRGSPRGVNALPFGPRGNGRGNARGNFRGNGRGRGGNFGPGRVGGAAVVSESTAETSSPSGQIDPNSFARPEPRGGFSGGRGARKLWVPT